MWFLIENLIKEFCIDQRFKSNLTSTSQTINSLLIGTAISFLVLLLQMMLSYIFIDLGIIGKIQHLLLLFT